ncbi:hypothetical protein ACOSOMT5_P0122 [Acidiphilium sp. MT5]
MEGRAGMRRWLVGVMMAVLSVAPVPVLAGQQSPGLAARLAHEYGQAALLARETHGGVEVLASGQGAARVYVFLPERPALPAGAVPIVFFHHGWQGMNPVNFGALIDHLAREGEIVVYPVYQRSAATSPQVVVARAAAADRRAVAMLASRGWKVDKNRVLYVGYSMGAAISLDFAIARGHDGVPAPRAMVLMAPGDAPDVATGPAGRSIIGDLRRLPPDLPIAVMAGAQDTSIGLPTARALFKRMCGVRADRRVLMVLPGASHDGVVVHSEHGAPGAPDRRYNFPLSDQDFPKFLPGQAGFPKSVSINQLDFFGFWKVIDAMVIGLDHRTLPSVVFDQQNPGQRYLGVWADGTPFPPIRIEDPCVPR